MNKKVIGLIGKGNSGIRIAKYLAMNQIGVGMFLMDKPTQIENVERIKSNNISDLFKPEIGMLKDKETPKSKFHK